MLQAGLAALGGTWLVCRCSQLPGSSVLTGPLPRDPDAYRCHASALLVGSAPSPALVSSLPFPAPARPALRSLFPFFRGGLWPKELPHLGLWSICRRICGAFAGGLSDTPWGLGQKGLLLGPLRTPQAGSSLPPLRKLERDHCWVPPSTGCLQYKGGTWENRGSV